MTQTISTSNLETAKKLIKKAEKSGKQAKPIIVQAQDNKFNRKLLEYGKFDILLSPEAGKKKDGIKQLDSGLNNVLAKIAAKNKISIGIDIKELSTLEKERKALRLARIAQNIKTCRKAKTKIKALNFKDEKDAFSLLLSLGASTKQAKEAF